MFAKLHSAGITSWRKSKGNGIKAEIFTTKSIMEVSPEDIVTEAFPTGIPKNFGVIGGPPCQDFSIQGNREGFEGERGKLTVVYFDRILALRPTFFVMENVTGLTKNDSTKVYLGELIKRVEAAYYIDHETLNALDFGVSQHRERIFFVGILKTKIKEKHVKFQISRKWFDCPENKKDKNAETKFIWPVAVPFGKSLKKPKNLPLELCVQSCLVAPRHINKTANAREYFNLYKKGLADIGEGETNRPSFKRLHRYKFSPTACYGNNEVHLHPYQHRRLSVRETLRIQGVPDTYVLPKDLSLTKKFKMIGNGVPVPLAEAVSCAVKNFLKEKDVVK